jgi:hypothetical protein
MGSVPAFKAGVDSRNGVARAALPGDPDLAEASIDEDADV